MPDLFSILCTTCKTKLRVRDPAVVGQILACPKCSSMVLVEAPPGWAPPLPGDVASATPAASNGSGQGESTILRKPPATPTTKSVVKPAPAPASPPTGKPASADASAKETVSDSHFGDVEALFGADAGKPAAANVAQAVKPKPKAAEGGTEKRRNTPAPPPPGEMSAPPANTNAAAKPVAEATPHRAKRIRMIALLTIGGLMGISLAVSAAYFAATWNNTPKDVAESPPVVPDTDPAEPVEPEPDPEDPSSETPSSETPSDDPPPQEPMDKEPSPPEQPGETENPHEPRDPLDIVNDKPRNEEPADISKLENQFKGLESDTGPMPVEGATSEEPSTETPEIPAAPPSRSRPEPRKVDLEARLADRVIEVEFTGQKLSDVLQFLSDFSTIPITLDPDALAWSKITPAAPVNARLSNATIEEVLAEVLKPFRLEAQKLEDQLFVTRSAAVRKIKCPIDDLTGGDAAKTQQLIEVIAALAAPDTWKSAGGVGSLTVQGNDLVVENTELAFGEVLHVCERLRQARGGRTKSVFPEDLFSLERRTARAAAKLDQPLTLNFGQPTLLVKILDRLGEETGTQIVVDWQAAGEAGWPPDCDATVTLDKTPLREALQKLLTPMDLTLRVIDPKTLQVTTPAALERKPEIEAYQAEDLAATQEEAKALLERVAVALGDGAVLRWDATSKTLLARLPQPQHERLASLLSQWREEAK